jgi:hypothetical protein
MTSMAAPNSAMFPVQTRAFRRIASNLQHTTASNFRVSFRRILPVLVGIFLALSAMPPVSASPVDPNANLPGPATYAPAQLSGRAPRTTAVNSDRTFERYGPQATQRAVRSSLKVALLPDPLAMAALIFCAFALRWMRNRRQSPARQYAVADRAPVVPRAA